MKPVVNYLSAVKAEFTKITWPNRRQTARLVIVVIAFSTIMAGTLGLVDFGFASALKQLITKG